MSDVQERDEPAVQAAPSSRRISARGAIIVALALISVMALAGGTVGYLLTSGQSRPTRHAGSPLPIYIQWRNLLAGDCINQPSDFHTIGDLQLVPCSRSHQMEVFAAYILPPGPYPGVPKLANLARVGCGARLEAYVGIAPEMSTTAFTYFYPLAKGWEFDRWVKCLLVSPSGHAGSLRGSKQ